MLRASLNFVSSIASSKEPLHYRLYLELKKRLYRKKYKLIYRPEYGYCINKALGLAKALGYQKVSVLEFGVSVGNGILNIEHYCEIAKRTFGIDFEIYGFDTGIGLPPLTDFRDGLFRWSEGDAVMDKEALEKRLKYSELIIGDVKDTVPAFACRDIAPIACMLFDLDIYTATTNSLKLFDLKDTTKFLPRVELCFDDIMISEYLTEQLAINEFNLGHETMKISREYKGGSFDGRKDRLHVCHLFDHPEYNTETRSKGFKKLDRLIV